jgi:transcriptional regulator with XRE-family HTH domain
MPGEAIMTPLNERLRQARERKGWTVGTLASRTGVRECLLNAIDRGDFGGLPAGLYGRAAIRAYAAEVGMDPAAVLDEAAPLLARVEDPLDGLARVRGLHRRRSSEAQPPPAAERRERDAQPVTGGSDCWQAASATAFDSLILVAVNGGVWVLTSIALGVSPAGAFGHAAPGLIVLWALIAAAYFVLLAGVRDGTPGALLAGCASPARPARPVTLRSSVRRGLRCAVEESSIAVQWLIRSAYGQHWMRTLRQSRA